MPIGRTPWVDDDGSGTTGTILNNAEKQALYDQIDAACVFNNQSQMFAAPDIRLGFKDTTAAPNASVFDWLNDNGKFNIRALNDALAPVATPMQIDRVGLVSFGGAVHERARGAAMGDPIDVAFNAAQFTALGGTWTVTAAPGNSYTMIGHCCTYTLHAQGTVSAGTQKLICYLPGGHSISRFATGTFVYTNGVGGLFVNGATIELTPVGFGGTFPAGVTLVGFTISYFFQ